MPPLLYRYRKGVFAWLAVFSLTLLATGASWLAVNGPHALAWGLLASGGLLAGAATALGAWRPR